MREWEYSRWNGGSSLLFPRARLAQFSPWPHFPAKTKTRNRPDDKSGLGTVCQVKMTWRSWGGGGVAGGGVVVNCTVLLRKQGMIECELIC